MISRCYDIGVAAADDPADERDGAFAFLLVRLGAHAGARFAEALAPLGIEPRHFGLLTRLAGLEGSSQQAIGTRIGLNPTRMVFLIDDLEERGLVTRRNNPTDRRSHALYLTPKGRKILTRGRTVARAHGDAMAVGLDPAERRRLTALLHKVQVAQGLSDEGLPGPPPGRG